MPLSQTPSSTGIPLAPDSTGPRTLRQKIEMAEISKQATESVSYGNGFIDAGTLVRQTKELGELHARMELILEAHPELREMNERHQELLIQRGQATEQEDIAQARQECADLARQIVEIESSVDCG